MSADSDFDKYWYYRHSVQSPEDDVNFFVQAYRDFNPGHSPIVFREDFCGTFALSCAWVKSHSKRQAVGIDLDPEPIAYGTKNYLSTLSMNEQKRVRILNKNVMSRSLPRADVLGALNFSYFFFKSRTELKRYFQHCRHSLNRRGIFLIDIFGGKACMEVNEDKTDCGTFTYYWDQSTFNPITHHSQFYIHYKRRGEKRRERVFSYDWRLWTLPEVKDILTEVGFRTVHIYWEGTDKNGDGNGDFQRSEVGDDSESWIAYIVAQN